MNRTDIINALIKKNSYSSYLEIGVQKGVNFDAINALIKIGVDPDITSKANVNLTSDEFFEQHKAKFDIIFIDGLHHADQVYKDINNALQALNPGGIIICHDMVPFDEISQRVPRETKRWTGDCWRAFVKLRTERTDLTMRVVDTDCGIGVIQPEGSQALIHVKDDITYETFEKNKAEYLNLITVEDFKKLYL